MDDGGKHPAKLNSGEEAARASLRQKPEKTDVELQKPLKSILKPSKAQGGLPAASAENHTPSRPLPTNAGPSKTARDRLAADDAEIAALEKALGIRNTRKLPASFKEEGLSELLESLDDGSVNELHHDKRNRVEEEEDWLRSKRLKVQSLKPAESDDFAQSIDEASVSLHSFSAEHSELESELIPDQFSDNAESDEEASVASSPAAPSMKRHRENPYIARVESLDRDISEKYVPPSLRGRRESDSEDHSRLRRRMQGLLNRLSEANLLALVRDFEDLYRNYPRQDVSTTIIDLLLDLLVDPSNLQDTFVILHAGFIAALYKVIGQDFGAMMISRINDEFDKLYRAGKEEASSNKRMRNLISLLAQLYNFKVIGSNLIYDLIKLFIQDLSESNTELLLKITRSESDYPSVNFPSGVI